MASPDDDLLRRLDAWLLDSVSDVDTQQVLREARERIAQMAQEPDVIESAELSPLAELYVDPKFMARWEKQIAVGWQQLTRRTLAHVLNNQRKELRQAEAQLREAEARVRQMAAEPTREWYSKRYAWYAGELDRLNAARAPLLALMEQLKALPRYQEYDVVRRPSTHEYFDAEQVEEAIAEMEAALRR